MNGPPPDGKAARTLDRSEAAQEDTPEASTAMVGDDDESRKFAELEDLAFRRGYTVRATSSGYILQRGTVSVHSGDLMALRHALVRMGQRQ